MQNLHPTMAAALAPFAPKHNLITPEELKTWMQDADNYFPEDDSKNAGYLEALEDLANRLGF